MVYFKMKMEAKIETLADGQVASPAGFRAGAVYAGIKPSSKNVFDLGILFSETVCNTAAVFTTNKIQAAPVILDRLKLSVCPQAQAIFVNAGCANACTGSEGMTNAVDTASLVAKHLGIDAGLVQVCSTGVIGTQLPMEKITNGIPRFALSIEGGHDFSRAIMTTDTCPKKIAVEVITGDFTFRIGGTAKGAGMIHPDMATLLCFLTTDAAVESRFLQECLKKAVAVSFNMITVDGDTSTNDTVLLMANGKAGNKMITKRDKTASLFQKALQQVCLYLAKCIAKDGEGATRLIEVEVRGARNRHDASLTARTIAGSPLVKTAVHGCDPNWGRVIAAAGRSGAALTPEKADVYIGEICLMEGGKPLAFDKKTASTLLNQDEVLLKVNLNLGKGQATAWGCDLSAEYVAINADYTT